MPQCCLHNKKAQSPACVSFRMLSRLLCVLYDPSPSPPLYRWCMQTRVAALCNQSYPAMARANCSNTATYLSTFTDSASSLVWLVDPVPPDPPVMVTAAVANNVLSGIVAPPAQAGFAGANRSARSQLRRQCGGCKYLILCSQLHVPPSMTCSDLAVHRHCHSDRWWCALTVNVTTNGLRNEVGVHASAKSVPMSFLLASGCNFNARTDPIRADLCLPCWRPPAQHTIQHHGRGRVDRWKQWSK